MAYLKKIYILARNQLQHDYNVLHDRITSDAIISKIPLHFGCSNVINSRNRENKKITFLEFLDIFYSIYYINSLFFCHFHRSSRIH